MSISPCTDFLMMDTPDQIMFAATARATMGSSLSQPVIATAPTPARTPTDVQTSVIKWVELASSVMELCFLPAFFRIAATPRLMSEAPTETASPNPICSSGLGVMILFTEAAAMARAATIMSVPSTALEKYSALLWP